jgi:hypothetical protein
MDDCRKCCVLSGRDLCDEPITGTEESYRLWCVVVCDLENHVNEEALSHWGGGCRAKYEFNNVCIVTRSYVLQLGLLYR